MSWCACVIVHDAPPSNDVTADMRLNTRLQSLGMGAESEMNAAIVCARERKGKSTPTSKTL